MKVSLVVVCHHSSAVLPICIEGFRRDAHAAGLESEVVVVEHSEDDREVEAVSACRPEKLLVRPNRGYAAGLNTGVAEAEGDMLLLANPDIRFLTGSVGALVDAVVDGADVAGPQLLWDDAGEVLLPIPDDPRPAAEIGRTIRRRWPQRRAIDRLFEASWQGWTADLPYETPSLRGPLMALAGATAERLGPLDEDYFLYYEETDWLWRARRKGARLVVTPRSRVVHRWGHATGLHPDTAAVEERSRVRFFERNYSPVVRALLKWLAPTEEVRGRDFTEVGGPEAVPEVDADVWLVSIVSHMEPAVGCVRCSGLPPAALELTAAGRWYAVAAGRERDRWRLVGSWMWQRT